MAYSRRVPKVDIRTLKISSTNEPSSKSEKEPAAAPTPTIAWHNPSSEIRAILWSGIPLILFIIIISIVDLKKGWVIPLAEWLMKH
jgi:hypothetical protein